MAIAANRRIGTSHSNCIYVQCWFLLQEMAIILVVESKTGRDDGDDDTDDDVDFGYDDDNVDGEDGDDGCVGKVKRIIKIFEHRCVREGARLKRL